MAGGGREWLVWAVAAVWLAAVAAGFAAWERYDATPGEARAAEPGAPPTGRWRLTVFAHPHCPCTRASLRELAELIAVTPVEAEVVFVRPAGVPDGWERGEAWDAAAATPGVRVACDPDGSAARRAGAATSGHAVLTDPAGRVAFAGGLTASRGRVGEGPARRAIRERLAGHESGAGSAPVFGCPLFGSCEATSGECQR